MRRKQEVDVAELLRHIGIEPLRQVGDEIKARCPMHFAITGKEDRRPSWSINQITGQHQCFSCSYKGNLHTLARDFDAPDAIDIDTAVSRRRTTESRYDLDAYRRAYKAFARAPRSALARRRISAGSAERYGIRWHDGAYILPITDRSGRFLGYQSKRDGEYWVTSATPMKSTLFGCHLVAASHVVVVESPLDVVRLADLGFPAVATFGVPVTPAQVELIRRFAEATLALDNDLAGIDATLDLLRALRRVRVADYGDADGKDPGDLDDATIRSVLAGAVSRLRARERFRQVDGDKAQQ